MPEQVCGATVTMGLGIHVHMPRHMPKETHTQVHTQADTSGSAGTCMHLGEAPPPQKQKSSHSAYNIPAQIHTPYKLTPKTSRRQIIKPCKWTHTRS